MLAFILALSACSPDQAISTIDAAQHYDAAIDTPADAPAWSGCMGTLPFSRTTTINTGDPLPAALVNEIQDNIVGDKHTDRVLVIMGTEFCVSEGAPTRTSPGGNPSAAEWNMPTTTPGSLVVDLGLPVGTTVTSTKVSYNRNSTGSAELFMSAFKISIGDGGSSVGQVGAGAGQSDTSTTGWGIREIMDGVGFTVASGFSYFFKIRGPNNGGTFSASPKVDAIRITYHRS